MKKSSLTRLVIMISIVTTFISCKKEVTDPSIENVQALKSANAQSVTRPFKMTSETWYRISPIQPTPLSNGQVGFANVPGGGTGNATHMGKISTWFNQLAYSASGQNPPSGTLTAPLVYVLNYPVLFPGAPLPLIQPGDFTKLAADNSWLQIPLSVNGQIVNAIIYNKQGEAIFLTHTSESITIPVSATRINFSGTGTFAGGRGKFANATGEYHFSGYFNPQNANDAGFSIDGWINY